MALYIEDTFTESSNVALESHVPESGGSWAKHPGFTTGAIVDAANDRATGGSSSSSSIYYNTQDPGSADYDVTAVVRASDTATGFPGLLARISTSENTFYQVYFSSSSNLQLQRLNNNTATTLFNRTVTFAQNTDYLLTLRVRGNRIQVLLDGRAVIDVIDSSPITAAGKAGFRCRSTSAVDSFVVTDNQIQGNVVVAGGIWTWFTDPRAVYRSGKYYIGAISEFGDIKIEEYDVASGVLKGFTLAAALEVDDHNNSAPLVLPSGKIACFYSKHNDASGSRYRVSTNAGDISAFDAEVVLTGQTTPLSYSNPFYLPAADKVFLFYTGHTGSGTRQQGYKSAAADLSAWDSEVLVCQGVTDTAAYFKYAQNGDDRIDILCTDLHPVQGNSSVYHFYAKWDAGSSTLKFYKSDGTEITASKPWNIFDEATLVYDGSIEKAWIWDIRIDGDGYPRVLFTRFPTDTDHRYYFSRWNGSAWTTPVQIAAAGTRLYADETYYSGGASFDGNDPNVVYLSIESNGAWEISDWRSDDEGATWSKHADITTNSGTTYKNARPYSPDGHDGTLGVLWWNGAYTSFTLYSSVTIRRAETDTGIEPGASLTGTSAATSGATGTLTGTGALSGTSAATSSATGSLNGAASLSGTSAATSGATGTLTNATPAGLEGTTAATSGATATLSAIGRLIGSSQIVTNATGTLANAIGHLSGTVTAMSGCTGNLRDTNRIWQRVPPASGTWTRV